jgi:micrococcal nuclease
VYEYRVKIRRVVDGDTVDVDIDLGFGVWLKKQ